MSLAVVGADYPNKGKSPARRFEIAICSPGDAIELRPEPKNPADEYAVAVYSERGVQLGYLRSERAAWMFRVIHDGWPVAAVFQEATSYGCTIRASFDGEAPALPAKAPSIPEHAPDFWPDYEPPDEYNG